MLGVFVSACPLHCSHRSNFIYLCVVEKVIYIFSHVFYCVYCICGMVCCFPSKLFYFQGSDSAYDFFQLKRRFLEKSFKFYSVWFFSICIHYRSLCFSVKCFLLKIFYSVICTRTKECGENAEI